MIKIFIDCVKQERYKYVEDMFSAYEIVHMGLEEFRDVIRQWANNNKNDIHTCYSPFINHVGRFRRDFGENWLGEEVRVFDPNPEYEKVVNYPYSKLIGYNGIRMIDIIEKI